MTHDEALQAWTRCAQVCHRKGSFYLEENDGELARKLKPFKGLTITQVAIADDCIWPSGNYTAIVRVGEVFYLAVR